MTAVVRFPHLRVPAQTKYGLLCPAVGEGSASRSDGTLFPILILIGKAHVVGELATKGLEKRAMGRDIRLHWCVTVKQHEFIPNVSLDGQGHVRQREIDVKCGSRG
jgi:hypothetical protein